MSEIIELHHNEYNAGRFAPYWGSSEISRFITRGPAATKWYIDNPEERQKDTDALVIGRAIHTLVLEGEEKYRETWRVARLGDGCPVNDKTGKYAGFASNAFKEWMAAHPENDPVNPATGELFDRKSEYYQTWAAANPNICLLTADEDAENFAVRDAVLRNKDAAELLASGKPEQTVRLDDFQGVPMQCRFDWVAPGNVIVDLKTVREMRFFKNDGYQFGYPRQFALYRMLYNLATGTTPDDVTFKVIVAEKAKPYQVAVLTVKPETLDKYEFEMMGGDNGIEKVEGVLSRIAGCLAFNDWPEYYPESQEIEW